MTARLDLRVAAGLVAVVTALTGTGCSVGLDRVPLPAPGVGSGTYAVDVSFANALNLPEKAKVRLSGADVGEVSRMTVRDFTAVVTIRIQNDVAVPVGTRAELRTATPLGDVFVSLTPPADADPTTPDLHDGDSIPLESTGAAATIEEVLTTASVLVNGGAVRNLTTLANGLGQAVGNRGDQAADLIADTTRLVRSLAARSDDIRNSLDRTNRLVGVLSDQQGTLTDFLDAAGPAMTTVTDNASQALALVHRVDRTTGQLAKLPALNGSEASGMIAHLNEISTQLNAAATAPGADIDSLNATLGAVTKTTNGAAAHASAEFSDMAIGALPDPAHPGDPGSHLPDQRDWQAFAGSLTYTLLRLQQRITGPGR